MKPLFRLKKAKNGELYFVLTAANGRVLVTSETYKREAGALNGIEAVKRCAPEAETVKEY